MEKKFVDSASQSTLDKNVTIRFNLNEFITIAQVYSAKWTVEQVLEDIASKFQLLPKYLTLRSETFGPKLQKTIQLNQLCKNDFYIVDVQLSLSDLAIHINHINEGIRNQHEKIRLDTDLYYRYTVYSI